jgi:hypothetical protein
MTGKNSIDDLGIEWPVDGQLFKRLKRAEEGDSLLCIERPFYMQVIACKMHAK